MAANEFWCPDADDANDNPTVADVLRCDEHGNRRALFLLAALVDDQVKCGDAEPDNDFVLLFRGGPAATRTRPGLSIREMLECVHAMDGYSSSCYVLAAVYLARLLRSSAARNAGLRIEPSTAHRLVAVALLLAAKLAHPRPVGDSFAFHVCTDGISAKEFNLLEVCFLRAIDYRLHVTADEFRGSCEILEGRSTGDAVAAGVGSCKKRKAPGADAGEGEQDRRFRVCVGHDVVACR